MKFWLWWQLWWADVRELPRRTPSAGPSPQLLLAGGPRRRRPSLYPACVWAQHRDQTSSMVARYSPSFLDRVLLPTAERGLPGPGGGLKPLTRDPAAWGLLGPPTRDRETVLQAFPCPKLSPSWALPLTSSVPPTRVASSQRWILGKCASRAHPTPPGQGCGGEGARWGGGHLLFSPHKVHLPWRCVLGLGVWLQDWGSTHFCQVATPRSFGGNRWCSILRCSS